MHLVYQNIPDVGVFVETHYRKSNKAEYHVSNDDGTTDVVLVAEPAGGIHDNSGEGVRGSNQALGRTD
jgi:hypothetical protein